MILFKIKIRANFQRRGTKMGLNSWLALDELKVILIDDQYSSTINPSPSETTAVSTSLTSQTTTLTTTTIFNSTKLFYSCNFNNDDCGGTPNPPFDDNQFTAIFDIFQYIQTAPLLSLSDFTSVSK